MNEDKSSVMFLQGNEAVALGAIDAGLSLFAGYPITPATEIAESLSILLPQNGGIALQMEDEIAALGAVLGASATGAIAMTATSGPGFSLMQENIGYASYAELPCVIAVIQRAGPSTGVATLPGQGDVMQARWGTHGDHPIVVLAPSTVEEMYTLTRKCFAIAETYRVPTILLADAIVGHMRERLTLPDDRKKVVRRKQPKCLAEEYTLPYQAEENGVPVLADLATGYRYCVTGSMHTERGLQTSSDHKAISALIHRLYKKLELAEEDICLADFQPCENAKILVLSYGCTARSAQQAVQFANEKGICTAMFRPITLWPFPQKKFAEAMRGIETVIVPEMNMGQYSDAVRCEVNRIGLSARIVSLPETSGRLTHPSQILKAIDEVERNA